MWVCGPWPLVSRFTTCWVIIIIILILKIIIIMIIIGHNGGVTGIQIQLNLAASSSYDSTVIIYNLD